MKHLAKYALVMFACTFVGAAVYSWTSAQEAGGLAFIDASCGIDDSECYTSEAVTDVGGSLCVIVEIEKYAPGTIITADDEWRRSGFDRNGLIEPEWKRVTFDLRCLRERYPDATFEVIE